jgi:hypothetical protein
VAQTQDGKEVNSMCDGKCQCEHPEKLQGKPGDCTPEQIRECHGENADHLCVKAETEKK